MKQICVFSSILEAEDFLFNQWRVLAEINVKKEKFFTAALSGGSTPVGFYKKLTGLPESLWLKTHIFIVDERHVPFNHKDSNFGMIKKELLDKIKIPFKNIHPINYINPIEKSVWVYNQEFESFSKKTFFDFVLLGIGSDGHTASLFPGTDFELSKHFVINIKKKGIPHERVSITLPVINGSKNVYFLVAGQNKAKIIDEVINKKVLYPSSFVKPKTGKLYFVLDKEAAGNLNNSYK